MLKGTRGGIVRQMRRASVHGQVIWDVTFVHDDDPEEQLHAARIGPEAVSPNLEPGDRVQLEYVLGSVVRMTKVR